MCENMIRHGSGCRDMDSYMQRLAALNFTKKLKGVMKCLRVLQVVDCSSISDNRQLYRKYVSLECNRVYNTCSFSILSCLSLLVCTPVLCRSE